MADLTLFCLVDGLPTSRAFSVKVSFADTVGDFKKLIKIKKTPVFDDIAADELTVWQVSIPVTEEEVPIVHDTLNEKKKLGPTTRLSKLFVDVLPEDTIHILVQRPPRATNVPIRLFKPPTMSKDQFAGAIEEMTMGFFAPGSPAAVTIELLLQGKVVLRETEGSIPGLPAVTGEDAMPRPRLLFWDLPEPSADGCLPEKSTPSKILEKLKVANQLSVFGVSGCGKTRSMIELLSQRWGFYFNAGVSDWGSIDMNRFIKEIMRSVHGEDRGVPLRERNNERAKRGTFLLLLARLVILRHCLRAHKGKLSFSSKHWMLLQVCPAEFGDIFTVLYGRFMTEFFNYDIDISILTGRVRVFLQDIRSLLIQQGLPNFKVDTQLLFILDEAQILGDRDNGSFVSQGWEKEDRPLLSPVLHALQCVGNLIQGGIGIIYCGTGLSNYSLEWDEGSAAGVKSLERPNLRFVEFQAWEGRESIQAYVDSLRDGLRDEKARMKLDGLLPQSAIDLLFEKLVGRFRPIITAIEYILADNDEHIVIIKDIIWDYTRGLKKLLRQKFGQVDNTLHASAEAIMETEVMEVDKIESLEMMNDFSEDFDGMPGWEIIIKGMEALFISPFSDRPGNLCHELRRVLKKNVDDPAIFRVGSIEKALEMSFYHQLIYGSPFVFNRQEPVLIEACFGRIGVVAGGVHTIIDEPFAYLAARNYFLEKDTVYKATEYAMRRLSFNPQVQGTLWETMIPRALISAFQQHASLSSWPLGSLDQDVLTTLRGARARIVGLDGAVEGIGKKQDEHLSMADFLTAHISHNSRKDGKAVPPFFFPSQYPSGPDLVFCMEVADVVIPVFIQVKLCIKLKSGNLMGAIVSVSSKAVQNHLRKEMVEMFCPKKGSLKDVYISMVIAYPEEVLDALICQPEPDAIPGHKQVRMVIDSSNIHRLFTTEHVELLELLKGRERDSEESG